MVPWQGDGSASWRSILNDDDGAASSCRAIAVAQPRAAVFLRDLPRTARSSREATNRVVQDGDVTQHAEILAISEAQRVLGRSDLSDCTIYSSVEPCPMCAFPIRETRIGRVVYAISSPMMGGFSKWNVLGDNEISNVMPEVFGDVPEVSAGLLYREAAAVWRKWNPMFWLGIRFRGCLAESDDMTTRIDVAGRAAAEARLVAAAAAGLQSLAFVGAAPCVGVADPARTGTAGDSARSRAAGYLSASAPACATWASWCEARPTRRCAPTTLPPATIGTPPSATLAPKVSTRRPTPPPATASSSALVGRRNSAAVRAFGFGDANRRKLRVVEAVQHHEVGAGVDDRDGDAPVVLGGLGFGRRHRLSARRRSEIGAP